MREKRCLQKFYAASMIFVCLFLLALPVWAAPHLPEAQHDSFYAQDNAGILTGETKAYLNKLGRELREKTKAQLVVVTVKTLESTPISEYANALFRKYKLGDAQLNNGCLLLVAVKDHKLRIEVGYGLEGCLTDGYTGSVRDKYLTPAFKKNAYNKGIVAAYNELAKKTAAEYKVTLTNLDAEAGSEAGAGEAAADKDDTAYTWFIAILIIVGILAGPLNILIFLCLIISTILEKLGLKKLSPPSSSRGGGGTSGSSYGSDSGSSNDDFGGGGDSGGGGSEGGW